MLRTVLIEQSKCFCVIYHFFLLKLTFENFDNTWWVEFQKQKDLLASVCECQRMGTCPRRISQTTICGKLKTFHEERKGGGEREKREGYEFSASGVTIVFMLDRELSKIVSGEWAYAGKLNLVWDPNTRSRLRLADAAILSPRLKINPHLECVEQHMLVDLIE